MVYVLPDPVAPYANTVVLIPYSTPDTKSRSVWSYTSTLVDCVQVTLTACDLVCLEAQQNRHLCFSINVRNGQRQAAFRHL
jgi:hypothetical protein